MESLYDVWVTPGDQESCRLPRRASNTFIGHSPSTLRYKFISFSPQQFIFLIPSVSKAVLSAVRHFQCCLKIFSGSLNKPFNRREKKNTEEKNV